MWREAQILAESHCSSAKRERGARPRWPLSLLTALALIVWAGSCSSLPDATCVACMTDCPSGLKCRGGVCVEPTADPVAVCGDKATENGGLGTGSSNTSVGGSGGAGGSSPTASGGAGASSTASGGTGASLSEGGEGGDAKPLGSSDTGGVECAASADCDPEIVTPSQLPVVCANSPIDIQLDAKCRCDAADAPRRGGWQLLGGPDGLSLRGDGRLSGALGVGTYEVTTNVTLDNNWTQAGTFELTVEPCNVLFLTESADAPPHVAAGSVDTGEVIHVPVGLGEDAEVTSFDASPDGKFIAQVVQSDSETKLELVEFGATPSLVDLEFPGAPVVHSFSPDSRWLAVVSGAPEFEPMKSLQLIDLGQVPPVELSSETFEHRGGLAWSDVGRLIYWGPVPDDDYFSVVHERRVREDGLGSDGTIGDTQMLASRTFVDFRVSGTGFATLTDSRLNFYSRTAGQTYPHTRPRAFSPGLEWMVLFETENTARLEPVDKLYQSSAPAFALVAGCIDVGAWSADDGSFVCMMGAAPAIYTVGKGELEGQTLPGGPRATNRMTLSAHGEWFAYTPNLDGLVVLRKDEWQDFELDELLIEHESGTNEWDFAFTRDESRLVVQRDRDLLVVDLTTSPLTVDQVNGISLPAVPVCQAFSLPWLRTWCGAPEFQGNLVLSANGNYVAFPDEAEGVTVVDVRTTEALRLGPMAESCAEGCIQFQ